MDYAERLSKMSPEQHLFETGVYPGEPAPGGYDQMEYDDWLQCLTPSERSAEVSSNPDEGCWDSDEETARLERIAMYSSTEEYDRYEGEDS